MSPGFFAIKRLTVRQRTAASVAVLALFGGGCGSRKTPVPAPSLRCGGAAFALAVGEAQEPELRVSRAPGEQVRLRIQGGAGRLAASPGEPGRLAAETGGERGVLVLRCEGPRALLRWEGPGTVALRLAAVEPPSLVFVPGGAPQGGDLSATFAVASWGQAALSFGAGRFSWRSYPPRFEVAPAGEVAVQSGDASSAVREELLRTGAAAVRLKGVVAPAPQPPGCGVVALDAEGRMAGATVTDPRGAFELAGASMAVMYASAGATRGGAAVEAREGAQLQAPEVGALRVRVVDHDQGTALPARIVVHGQEGRGATPGGREPNLGPPHRATGAGPLLDTEDGQARLLLPGGLFRVLATRGLEYTVDEQVVEVIAGAEQDVELRLRRVVATPGWAGCDLHVHARGSFDSLVAIEDRVRSLMAAGIDLAAASEHNRTGSYDLSTVAGQGRWLTWIPAVEVTSVDPPRGHFNVLPYDRPEAPRYDHTSLQALLAFVAKKSPGSLVQVNHPRMGKLGHFNALHLDPETQRGLGQLAKNFELLEIYNGFDLAEPAKTEALLVEWLALVERGRTHWATGNSDSHSVQYIGAGYPRTYGAVAEDHDGGEGAPLAVAGLLEGLRRGRIVATSGPFVAVTQGPRGPGDALAVEDRKARVRVQVWAAPWVDTAELEVFVGAKSALRREIRGMPERRTGRPEGSLEEGRKAALRVDEELVVPVAPGARGLVVVVRGRRKVGDVLPFMDWAPLAIVNPMRIEAR